MLAHSVWCVYLSVGTYWLLQRQISKPLTHPHSDSLKEMREDVLKNKLVHFFLLCCQMHQLKSLVKLAPIAGTQFLNNFALLLTVYKQDLTFVKRCCLDAESGDICDVHLQTEPLEIFCLQTKLDYRQYINWVFLDVSHSTHLLV